MQEKMVYVVGGGKGYYRPFAKFGDYCDNKDTLSGTLEEVQDKVSLVLFTGGSDVDPSLYGEKRGRMTSFFYDRDAYEAREFLVARKYNLPIVGVCRGAQFLCAMAGGRLVQHCENHGRDHLMELWDGRIMMVSSTHHQMQLPPKDAHVLGWASPSLSKTHLDGEGNEIEVDCEVEIAYYEKINALGIQHHPEMQGNNEAGFRIAAELAQEMLKPLS